jgi:hypothetical protein
VIARYAPWVDHSLTAIMRAVESGEWVKYAEYLALESNDELLNEKLADKVHDLIMAQSSCESLRRRVAVLEAALQKCRGALSDIGVSTDMTRAVLIHKANRIYQETAAVAGDDTEAPA